MTTKSRLALGMTVAVMVACTMMSIPACSQFGPCLASSTRSELWGSSIRAGMLLVVAGTWLTWFVRLCHLLLKTRYLVAQLPVRTHPVELQEATERTGAARVVCIDTDTELAFCCGAVRPAIYLSSGLLQRLRPCELDAVLLHEMHHGQRRDPLRYAMVVALKDVCFYIPLLGWFVHYQRENAELRADRVVMDTLGPRPLAGALWALSDAPAPALVAAFQGAAELRAAQVLGDSMPVRRPAGSLWLASVVGIVSLLATANCIAQIMPLR